MNSQLDSEGAAKDSLDSIQSKPLKSAAVPSETCDLYEWTTKQLLLQFGKNCSGCSE